MGIKFRGSVMKGIWRILNLANFESHGLMTSQNGYRHTILNVSLLAIVSNFGHSKVPSSPSRNLFGIVHSSHCPVLRGIVTVSTTNRIALHAKFACERSLCAPFTCFISFAESVILQRRFFPLWILQQG